MSVPEVPIDAVCEIHQGSGRLVVRREGDRVMLDGRADACCLITPESPAMMALFDALVGVAEVTGRLWWVLGPTDQTGHLLVLESAGYLTTQYGWWLPPGFPSTMACRIGSGAGNVSRPICFPLRCSHG